MIELVAVCSGVVIGATIALGDRARGIFAYLAGFALLATSIVWLTAISASLAGSVLTVTLFVAFASTKAYIWRNLPSLHGLSFPHRAFLALAHSRRLSQEDARVRSDEYKSR